MKQFVSLLLAALMLLPLLSGCAAPPEEPEIARGTSEILPCDNVDLCLIRRTWGAIAVNPSLRDHTIGVEGTLADALNAKGLEITWKDGVLTLPSYSVAILK